mmetsp:Transcript_61730/g.200079  ORF Transcript_61730/g.200079 Transcript_61730/m.200079 type:complete len:251 (+) Transcript_61730:39-791(+)
MAARPPGASANFKPLVEQPQVAQLPEPQLEELGGKGNEHPQDTGLASKTLNLLPQQVCLVQPLHHRNGHIVLAPATTSPDPLVNRQIRNLLLCQHLLAFQPQPHHALRNWRSLVAVLPCPPVFVFNLDSLLVVRHAHAVERSHRILVEDEAPNLGVREPVVLLGRVHPNLVEGVLQGPALGAELLEVRQARLPDHARILMVDDDVRPDEVEGDLVSLLLVAPPAGVVDVHLKYSEAREELEEDACAMPQE